MHGCTCAHQNSNSIVSPSLQVVTTISRGRLVWDGEKLTVEEGSGRFVPLPLFPTFEDASNSADSFPSPSEIDGHLEAPNPETHTEL